MIKSDKKKLCYAIHGNVSSQIQCSSHSHRFWIIKLHISLIGFIWCVEKHERDLHGSLSNRSHSLWLLCYDERSHALTGNVMLWDVVLGKACGFVLLCYTTTSNVMLWEVVVLGLLLCCYVVSCCVNVVLCASGLRVWQWRRRLWRHRRAGWGEEAGGA